jgi:hypothetical protein
MTQRTRILIAIVILVVLVGAILGIDALRRLPSSPPPAAESKPTVTHSESFVTPETYTVTQVAASMPATQVAESEPTLMPGSIPIRLDGQLVGSFSPADLDRLEKVSFVESQEGKKQEGWLLRDVILLHVDSEKLKADSLITVSSRGRNKSAQLTWAEVDEPANLVMFDLSNRGTLKLVSLLEKLDTREEWVQDADQIEITSP